MHNPIHFNPTMVRLRPSRGGFGTAAVDPPGLEGRSEVDGKIGPFSIFADLTKGKKGLKYKRTKNEPFT